MLLDLDGCVWVDQTATPNAREALAELRNHGKTLAFVTNDSRLAPEEYVRKMWSMGLQASLEEIVTVGSAIQYVLADRRPGTPTFVIGSAAIFRHVADAGQRIVNGTDRAPTAEIVVVAGHDDFSFAELRTATQAVLNGAEMIAAGRDRTFPASDGYWPATGAILAALEYATERTARSVGKPDVLLFETALDRLGPGPALMVGDRLDADLGGAAAAGIDGAIVLTGRDDPRPGRGGRGSGSGGRRREPACAGDRVTLSVIVNPFAGGGRAARELNGVEATLRRLSLDHHVQRTRSLDHARELALAAAEAGEIAVAFGGDGLIGAVADALRHTDGVLGVLPGGRGNDFVRMLGIPGSPQSACEVLAHGEVRRLDLGVIGDKSFIGIASCGFDSVANRIANETTARARQARLRLWAVAGAGRMAPGDVHHRGGWRGAAHGVGLHGGGRQLSLLRGRHDARPGRHTPRRHA